MTNSKLFSMAHQITRKVRKAGDDYRATFGAVLKALKAGWRPTKVRTFTRPTAAVMAARLAAYGPAHIMADGLRAAA